MAQFCFYRKKRKGREKEREEERNRMKERERGRKRKKPIASNKNVLPLKNCKRGSKLFSDVAPN